jgi:hypothetical protein
MLMPANLLARRSLQPPESHKLFAFNEESIPHFEELPSVVRVAIPELWNFFRGCYNSSRREEVGEHLFGALTTTYSCPVFGIDRNHGVDNKKFPGERERNAVVMATESLLEILRIALKEVELQNDPESQYQDTVVADRNQFLKDKFANCFIPFLKRRWSADTKSGKSVAHKMREKSFEPEGESLILHLI